MSNNSNDADSPRISVVFPAYNEADSIAEAVAEFGAVDAVAEVIVVDNNSDDGTGALATEAGGRVVKETRQGYGYALRRGMREAKADLVLLAEPDGTFTASDVAKLLAYAADVELVLGTRTAPELIWHSANMGLFMRWGNWAVAKLLQLLFNTSSLTDCGCTMRLIRRQSLERIQPYFTVGGSHFLPEMVILARKKRLSMVEVPVNYRQRAGVSKITGDYVTAVKVGARMVQLILRSRFRSTRGPAPGGAPGVRSEVDEAPVSAVDD